MSSKISSVDTRTGAVGAGRPVERVLETGSGAQQQGTTDSADVYITGTARQLADLEQAVQNMPAIDEAKVSAVRTALEQGTYEIDPRRIADQLVQIEQALAPLGESEQ